MDNIKVYETEEEKHAYKMKWLLIGLRGEVRHGMKLTNKAPSCYSQVKKLFGYKGNKQKVLYQFELNFYKNGGRII